MYTCPFINVDGALSILFPLWGSFSIGINGEKTPALDFDAGAEDIRDALQNFYSLKDVTVLKDGYVVPYKQDGTTPFFPVSAAAPLAFHYAFSIWTIEFRTSCSDSTGILTTGYCQDYDGAEPLLEVDSTNIQYLASPYIHQVRPTITAMQSRRGYSGNNRLNSNDLNSIALSLIPRSGAGTVNSGTIGMTVKQRLVCTAVTTGGSFILQLMNDTVTVQATFVANDLSVALNAAGGGIYSVSVATDTAGVAVCGANTGTTITFLTPVGQALPLMQVVNAVKVTATVSPLVDSLDSTIAVNASLGTYMLMYTPTVAGMYDLTVSLNSVSVSNVLTAGVMVTPDLEYAATSTHNISQVTKEGVREYFSVQLRDMFGNNLVGPMDSSSSFLMTMYGSPADCQSDSLNAPVSSVIPVYTMVNEPYTDGSYTMIYDPTTAGSYELSVQLLTKGGLLATYYKTANLTQPVLASLDNFHDGLYHKPYWCDGLMAGNFSAAWNFGAVTFCDQTISTCGCDSTRLDSSLSFAWGDESPLPFSEPYSGKFPSDYFSVQW